MAEVRFWNTLAVEDVERAREFYSALGFTIDDVPGGAGITVAPVEGSLVCLFSTQAFAGMIPGRACDTARSQEVIQSMSVDSREGVDALAAKAKAAGARMLGEPKEEPYGYGCGFADPDGHVWAVLWMLPPPS
jgi:uncharacterized protein